jgi:cyclophilin family peptidyl-prolyl cis-trans isomerase
VHRIVKDFIIQLGDITRQDGSGGDSIYNGKFNDEPAGLKAKVEKYSVAMANAGKNSNTSQFFFVVTDDSSKLKLMSGKHVVFGKVVDGFAVLDRLNAAGKHSGGDVPLEKIWVSNCGVL